MKTLLSPLLSIVVCVGLLPFTALATGKDGSTIRESGSVTVPENDLPGSSQNAPTSPPIVPDSSAVRKTLDEYVTRIEAFGFCGAVLVLRGDDVLLKRGCGYADREKEIANTADTLFDIGSVTKSFTAAAIVKLASAGTLKLDDPIGKHLSPAALGEQPFPVDKAAITFHHLLTHTSGLPRGVRLQGAATEGRHAAIRQMLALPLEFAPGQRWSYSNPGYELLGCLIEEITGEPFEAHMKWNLFRPAGMMHAAFLHDGDIAAEPIAIGYSAEFPGGVVGPADKQWYHWGLRGCGGILLSIEDFLHWEQALRGESVLRTVEKEKLFAPHMRTGSERGSYGYGWEVGDEFAKGIRARFVGHGGDTRGFECKFYRFPEERIAIAICSNTTDHFCWWMPSHIANILFGRDIVMPPRTVALETEALKRWEGAYRSDDGVAVELRADNGRLVLTPVGQAATDLLDDTPAWTPPGAKPPIAAGVANERAERAIGALITRDVKALEELVDSQWPRWPQTLCQRMDREAEQRGALRGKRLLGTYSDEQGRRCTLVELQFERESERVALRWNGDRITHFDFPTRRTTGAIRFVPESDSRFNSFDIASSRSRTLEFEAPAVGNITARLHLGTGRTISLRK